jgi:hypothetical protein
MEGLTLSGFITQASMLFFMLTGTSLIKEHSKYDIIHVTSSYPHGEFYISLGRLVFAVFLSIAYFVSACVILSIQYAVSRVPAEWFFLSIKYLICYLFIPNLYSMLIGMILYSIISNRGVFFLVIPAWLMLGPLNQGIYSYLVTGLDLNVKSNFLPYIMNLAQIDSNFYSSFVYGFPLESIRWSVKFDYFTLLFLISVLLFITMIYKIKRYKYIFSILVITSLFIPTFATYKNYVDFYTKYSSSHQRYVTDLHDYYHWNAKNPDIASTINHEINFNVYQTEISLKTYELGSEICSELHGVVTKDTMEQVFTLYHGYQIDEIMVNNSSAQFNRIFDTIVIHFGSMIQSGSPLIITVKYHGMGSPAFFCTSQAIQLHPRFPWIPKAGFYTFGGSESDGLLVGENWGDPVEYVLHYDGPGRMYSNITKVNDHLWTGASDTGLFIIGGYVNSANTDDFELIYPDAIYANVNRMNEYFEVYNQSAGLLDKYFDIRVPCPETYVIINYTSSCRIEKITDHIALVPCENATQIPVFPDIYSLVRNLLCEILDTKYGDDIVAEIMIDCAINFIKANEGESSIRFDDPEFIIQKYQLEEREQNLYLKIAHHIEKLFREKQYDQIQTLCQVFLAQTKTISIDDLILIVEEVSYEY